tara:strand:+ start:886 stop:1740 length:855 start_codon:yes stop_codon:yes gene_type:complete
MHKHIGLVDLMGGLGNQIFQLNFANYLKRRGFKVYVNLSWFNSDIFNDGTTKRNLQLKPSDFELNEVNESTEKKFLRIENLLNTKLINKLAARILKESYYLHSGHLFNEENIKKYNRFSGYWQNEKYLVGQKTFLLNSLNKTSHFNENLNKPNKKTLIHIRKTDYLKLDEELSEAFYINAIKEIINEDKKMKYDIFTDEKNPSLDSNLYKNAENVNINSGENPLTTISKMMNYKNYIIANSTFSLLPAYLSYKSDSIVIYPKPWFKHSEFNPPVEQTWRSISDN